jgi:UPF0716 family protein affecting phage T7 exclusion
MTRTCIVLIVLIGLFCSLPPARAFVTPEHYQRILAEEQQKQADATKKPSRKPVVQVSPADSDRDQTPREANQAPETSESR